MAVLKSQKNLNKKKSWNKQFALKHKHYNIISDKNFNIKNCKITPFLHLINFKIYRIS